MIQYNPFCFPLFVPPPFPIHHHTSQLVNYIITNSLGFCALYLGLEGETEKHIGSIGTRLFLGSSPREAAHGARNLRLTQRTKMYSFHGIYGADRDPASDVMACRGGVLVVSVLFCVMPPHVMPNYHLKSPPQEVIFTTVKGNNSHFSDCSMHVFVSYLSEFVPCPLREPLMLFSEQGRLSSCPIGFDFRDLVWLWPRGMPTTHRISEDSPAFPTSQLQVCYLNAIALIYSLAPNFLVYQLAPKYGNLAYLVLKSTHVCSTDVTPLFCPRDPRLKS